MLKWDELEKLQKLLSEDRYDSKDWRSGGLVERVEWLITMYEEKKKELDDIYENYGVPTD